MRIIVQHLPITSAFARAQGGTELAWGLQEQLLASVLDELRIIYWAYSAVHRDGSKAAPPPPDPTPRPGVKAPEPKGRRIGRGIPMDELNRILKAQQHVNE